MTPPRRILILNQHVGNHGDDAAGLALLTQVRAQYPHAALDIVYNWRRSSRAPELAFDDDNTTHHVDLGLSRTALRGVVPSWLRRALRQPGGRDDVLVRTLDVIDRADRVIVAPSGANIGVYRDRAFLFRVALAVARGKRPLFHLNTIGKSGDRAFDVAARAVLARSQLFVREQKCQVELAAWGLASVLGVDTALGIARPPIARDPHAARSLALIVSNLAWHPAFAGEHLRRTMDDVILPAVADAARAHDLDVQLVPHLYGLAAEPAFLEQCRARVVQSGMDEARVRIRDDVKSVADYERVIATAHMVVSGRYQGVVFALKHAVPFLSLSYENKMREACSYAGMLDFHVDLHRHDLQRASLVALCARLHHEHADLHAQLDARLPDLQRRARLPLAAWARDDVTTSTGAP